MAQFEAPVAAADQVKVASVPCCANDVDRVTVRVAVIGTFKY